MNFCSMQIQLQARQMELHNDMRQAAIAENAPPASADELIETLFNKYQDIINCQAFFPDAILSSMLDLVSNHVELLMQQANTHSDRLPAKLQEAIGYILLCKTKGACITMNDLVTTLAELKERVHSAVVIEVIEKAERLGLEHLLNAGFALIQNKTGKPCLVHLSEYDLPTEVTFNIINGLGTDYESKLNFGMTSKHVLGAFYGVYETKLKSECEEKSNLLQQGKTEPIIYRYHPPCRKEKHAPDFANGREYLNELGIGGYVTRLAIKTDKLTIATALARKESILQEIKQFCEDKNRPDIYVKLLTEPYSGVLKYLIDQYDMIAKGKLIVNYLMVMMPKAAILHNPYIQALVDVGAISINKVCELTPLVLDLLQTPCINSNILKGIFIIDELCRIAIEMNGTRAIKSPVIQKYIYHNKLNLQNAAKLTLTAVQFLEIPVVQCEIIEKNTLVDTFLSLEQGRGGNIERITLNSNCFFIFQKNILKLLEQEKLSLEKAFNIDKKTIDMLCKLNENALSLLFNNKVSLKDFKCAHNVEMLVELLNRDLICELINQDKLSVMDLLSCNGEALNKMVGEIDRFELGCYLKEGQITIKDLVKLNENYINAQDFFRKLDAYYDKNNAFLDISELHQLLKNKLNCKAGHLVATLILLNEPGVKKYTTLGTLDRKDVLDAKPGTHFLALNVPSIQELIDDQIITIDVVLHHLSDEGIEALTNPTLQAAVKQNGLQKVALKSWFRSDVDFIKLKRKLPETNQDGFDLAAQFEEGVTKKMKDS